MARKKWPKKIAMPQDTPTHTACRFCGLWVGKATNRVSSFVRPDGTKIDVLQCPYCDKQFMVNRQSTATKQTRE